MCIKRFIYTVLLLSITMNLSNVTQCDIFAAGALESVPDNSYLYTIREEHMENGSSIVGSEFSGYTLSSVTGYSNKAVQLDTAANTEGKYRMYAYADKRNVTNGVIYQEAYFKFANFTQTRKLFYAMDNRNTDDKNNTYTSSYVQVSKRSIISSEGKISFGSSALSSTNISKNTWYKIGTALDMDNGVTYFYFGTPTTYKYVAKQSTGTHGGYKASIFYQLKNSYSATMIMDEYKSTLYLDRTVFDWYNPNKRDTTVSYSSRPTPAQISADYKLRGQHPRLLATPSEFAAIKADYNSYKQGNPSPKGDWYDYVIKRANDILSANTHVRYEITDGVRLLSWSSSLKEKMTVLGMAYQLTGDTKYSDWAYEELAIAGGSKVGPNGVTFTSWHPQHGLDVGVMAGGYAIGYDWMYDAFTQEQRAVIAKGMYNIGYRDILGGYLINTSDLGTSLSRTNNWNAFNNGSVMLAAAAFYDEYPIESAYIISSSVRAVEEMIWHFKNTGAWFEGPSYAAVNVQYYSLGFSTLESCFGSLYGLDQNNMFKDSYDFIRNIESNVGTYNFADAGFTEMTQVCGGWINKHYGKSRTEPIFVGNSFSPSAEIVAQAIVWCDGEGIYEPSELSVNYFDDEIDKSSKKDASPAVIAMHGRGTQNKPFVGVKYGETIYDHSQFDSASFVFDSQGVRWAWDMGSENYNLTDSIAQKYSSITGDSSGRFYVFRNRAEAHNTLIVNPSLESPTTLDYVYNSESTCEDFVTNDSGTIAKLNTTALLADNVTKSKRAFCFTDNRESLVVRDEICAKANDTEIDWLMYTKANAEIVDDCGRILLRDKSDPSKIMILDFVSNKSVTPLIESADTHLAAAYYSNVEYKGYTYNETSNADYLRIRLKINGINAGETTSVTVKLTPINIIGSEISAYDKGIDLWDESLITSNNLYLDTFAKSNDDQKITPMRKMDFDTPIIALSPADKSWYTYLNAFNAADKSYSASYSRYATGGYSDMMRVVDDNGNRVLVLSSKYQSDYYYSSNGVNTPLTGDSSYIFMYGPKTTEGVLKFSAKAKFDDFVANKELFSTAYYDSANTRKWLSPKINIRRSYGTHGYAEFGGTRIGVDVNHWYLFEEYLDMDTKTITAYCDGKVIGSVSYADDVARFDGTRAACYQGATANEPLSTMYIDDFCIDFASFPDNEFYLYVASNGTGGRVYANAKDGKTILTASDKDGSFIGANIAESIPILDYYCPNASTFSAYLWVNDITPLREKKNN